LFKFALLISCVSLTLLSGDLRAETVLYENALPKFFLNDQAGALRSNIAFTESDPIGMFDGTDVQFKATGAGGTVTVNSVTTWSVASIMGQALGLEFDSVSLYFRPLGGTWAVATDALGNPETGTPDTFFDSTNPDLVLNSNPDITHTSVTYRNGESYEGDGTPGVFYPLWQNTFSGLDLNLTAGVTYEFAVWGTSSNPDPNTLYGYWFNHYSNPFLSIAREDNKSGEYLRCDATNLSAPCFNENPKVDQTWNKRANENIVISGIVTPEPSTFLMSGAPIFGLTWLLMRRRKTARSARGFTTATRPEADVPLVS
jgi:hypothetical protein